jgi:DNA-binding winged helix-turn-helix (wHTH) protein
MRAETLTGVAELPARSDVTFGPFRYDRASRLLRRDEMELPLPPRVLAVLDLRLDRPGQVVSKQDLLSSVWRDAFVSETSLAEAISVLRQTLGDDPQHPGYIQTLHRRGYRFIADVRVAEPSRATLPSAMERSSAPRDEAAPRLWLVLPWTIALFSLLVAAVAVWKFTHAVVPAPASPVRFMVALPTGVTLATTGAPIALSPDGALLAFAGCRSARGPGAEPDCAIYIRPLAQSEPTLVAGTAGGESPFFSPDARWLGFFAHGRLLKIALAGGSPVALADAARPWGATWMRDDRIVFAGGDGGGLSIVAASGGAAGAITQPAAEERSHRWPDVVADGSAVVFTVESAKVDETHAAVLSLRTLRWGRVLDGVTAVRAPLPGYLLAQRRADLTAVPFDDRSLSALALPTEVAAAVLPAAGPPRFAMASAGTLAYGTAATGDREQALHVVLDWATELQRMVPRPGPRLPR